MPYTQKQEFWKNPVFWFPAGTFFVFGAITLASALGAFDSTQFLPHATCYLRNSKIILLHVSSDLVIGISYLSISLTLGYLVQKTRRIIPFQWVFLAFGLFIITCGFTHLMEVVTVWRPLYWLAGWVKALTAVASAGTAIGLVFVLPSIFKFLTSAQASEKHRQGLVAANEELNAFAYSVSHDLRAPLRAVQGMSAALKEDFDSTLPPEAKVYLDRIVGASTRMDALISDLLQYSRVSRTELEVTPVEIGEALQEARNSISSQITESGAAITVEGDSRRVLANKTLLVQVLTNLLDNAIKFVPNGTQPRVRLVVEPSNGMTRISVVDNGIGIAKAYQEKIFKIFERLHGHSEYPGTGIGLAIVHRAITRMNGRIGVDSEAGKGSTFWVELPNA